VENTVSSYNANVIKSVCSICKKSTEDIHHINEQHRADVDGYIGHVHKNNLSNLVQLCKECHNNVHYGNLSINRYEMTSDGVQLNYEYKENDNKENIEKEKDHNNKENIEIKELDNKLDNKEIKELDNKESKVDDKVDNKIDELIKSTYDKCKSMSETQRLLKSLHNINITVYKIRKLLKSHEIVKNK
jgi:hypothetical protein